VNILSKVFVSLVLIFIFIFFLSNNNITRPPHNMHCSFVIGFLEITFSRDIPFSPVRRINIFPARNGLLILFPFVRYCAVDGNDYASFFFAMRTIVIISLAALAQPISFARDLGGVTRPVYVLRTIYVYNILLIYRL